jgi:hypothetical protein
LTSLLDPPLPTSLDVGSKFDDFSTKSDVCPKFDAFSTKSDVCPKFDAFSTKFDDFSTLEGSFGAKSDFTQSGDRGIAAHV